jgi:hypothetical protein
VVTAQVSVVHFKNRYIMMEVFGTRESGPVIVTASNIVKVIRDSIQFNFS